MEQKIVLDQMKVDGGLEYITEDSNEASSVNINY